MMNWYQYSIKLWGHSWAIARKTPKNLDRYGQCLTKKEYLQGKADYEAYCGMQRLIESDPIQKMCRDLRLRSLGVRPLAEIVEIMRAEHDAGDGHFSTGHVEAMEALLDQVSAIEAINATKGK